MRIEVHHFENRRIANVKWLRACSNAGCSRLRLKEALEAVRAVENGKILVFWVPDNVEELVKVSGKNIGVKFEPRPYDFYYIY